MSLRELKAQSTVEAIVESPKLLESKMNEESEIKVETQELRTSWKAMTVVLYLTVFLLFAAALLTRELQGHH